MNSRIQWYSNHILFIGRISRIWDVDDFKWLVIIYRRKGGCCEVSCRLDCPCLVTVF
ncbi:hypothetical protein Hanom_Chr09g00806051 [Helianthus anomalus]